jgi:hypothetical protein
MTTKTIMMLLSFLRFLRLRDASSSSQSETVVVMRRLFVAMFIFQQKLGNARIWERKFRHLLMRRIWQSVSREGCRLLCLKAARKQGGLYTFDLLGKVESIA